MNIVLVGYMGSGKSVVGKNLSELLDYVFVDLDDYVETQENSTIPEIFETKGEIYFRKMEHVYLQTLLKRNNLILSLGGGTPCYGGNMDLILQDENVQSIYLKCSIPTLVKRLKTEKSTRPLISHLQTDEALTEFIGKHLFERSFFYSQSHHVILTDDKPVTHIIQEIMATLF